MKYRKRILRLALLVILGMVARQISLTPGAAEEETVLSEEAGAEISYFSAGSGGNAVIIRNSEGSPEGSEENSEKDTSDPGTSDGSDGSEDDSSDHSRRELSSGTGDMEEAAIAEEPDSQEEKAPEKTKQPSDGDSEPADTPAANSPHFRSETRKQSSEESSSEPSDFVSIGRAVLKPNPLLREIPEYQGHSWVMINGDKAAFAEEDFKKGESSFIALSALDRLGRCGSNWMSADQAHLPTEKRGEIGNVRPTGWRNAKYDMALTGTDSPYLYNRSHLLMYALSGLNAEPENLITGTRQMNLAMLRETETTILAFVRTHPGMHMLYRATPYFRGEELLARGVLIEAASVEDHGETFSLCRFFYNVERNVQINYADGDSTGPAFTDSGHSVSQTAKADSIP